MKKYLSFLLTKAYHPSIRNMADSLAQAYQGDMSTSTGSFHGNYSYGPTA